MFAFATLLTQLALAAPEPPTPPAPPEAPEAPAAPDVPAVPTPPRPPVPPAPRFEANDRVSFSGPANDVFGVGGQVLVDSEVGDNAFLFGGELQIDEPVHGDLFAAGGEIHIDAPVHGDAYVFGGEIVLGPKGRIDGHLLGGGGQWELDGPVAGNVGLGGGHVGFHGSVGGDVTVEAGEVVLGPDGRIGGDFRYSSPERIDTDGHVDGKVSWTETDEKEMTFESVAEPAPPKPGILETTISWSFWNGWEYVAKLIVGAVLLLLGGTAAGRVGRTLVDRPAESLGWGIAAFLVLPAASTAALILIVPFPLGLVGYTLFAVMLYVAQLFAAQAVGDMILKRFRPEAWGSPVVSLAVGLVPLVVFGSIPWVGFLVWYIATLLGFGAAWLSLRELARG